MGNPPANNRSPGTPAGLGLTDRQVDVLALMMEGKSNKAICRTLDLAEPTVKYHVTTILKALKVSNRTEAVLTIGRLGWKLPPTTNNKQNAEGIDENEQSTTKTVLAPTPKAQSERLDSVTPPRGHRQATTHVLPDKASIVVLPFANLSGDPSQDYFADGMVEDITIALGRLPWLFVIGSSSAFTYKNLESTSDRSERNLA